MKVTHHAPGCTYARFWTFAGGQQVRPCSCGATSVEMGLTDDYLTALTTAEGLTDLETTLVAEVIVLREEMRTMHKSVVHDCCVAVQQVQRLADTIEKEIAPIVGDKPTVVDRIRAALVIEYPTAVVSASGDMFIGPPLAAWVEEPTPDLGYSLLPPPQSLEGEVR